MAVMVFDCPHCSAGSSTFNLHKNIQHPIHVNVWILLLTCGACGEPICSNVQTTTAYRQRQNEPAAYPGDICANQDFFRVLSVFPEPQEIEIPDNVPDKVARAFKQAAQSAVATHYDAACGMYRRTMELALKAFCPEVEAWKLEKRIDKLASENRITVDIKEWAHELRLDGNEALHGEEEATKEMAEQMHGLCKFLLVYLYTLPNQVAQTRARREVDSD